MNTPLRFIVASLLTVGLSACASGQFTTDTITTHSRAHYGPPVTTWVSHTTIHRGLPHHRTSLHCNAYYGSCFHRSHAHYGPSAHPNPPSRIHPHRAHYGPSVHPHSSSAQQHSHAHHGRVRTIEHAHDHTEDTMMDAHFRPPELATINEIDHHAHDGG